MAFSLARSRRLARRVAREVVVNQHHEGVLGGLAFLAEADDQGLLIAEHIRRDHRSALATMPYQ